MNRIILSLVFSFCLVSLFAQNSTAEQVAAQNENIVTRPCPKNQGDCFFKKEKLNGQKTILTRVVFDEASAKFIEANERGTFKIIEEPSNTEESKRKAKEKAKKNKGKKDRKVEKFKIKRSSK